MTLSSLEACSFCAACDLASTRQTVVISRGNPKADLMLIGEAPGAQEDACLLYTSPSPRDRG